MIPHLSREYNSFSVTPFFLFSWYAILTENRKGCGNTQQRHRRASQPASNLGRITKESPCRSMGTDTIKKRTQIEFDLGSLWWSRRSTSSDHQIVQGLHLLVSWRFFLAWMMCILCCVSMLLTIFLLVFSYLQFSIVQRKREQLRAV